MQWLLHPLPVLLHVHVAMDSCQHADVHAVHDHVNYTMIGHGAAVEMILNLVISKCAMHFFMSVGMVSNFIYFSEQQDKTNKQTQIMHLMMIKS